MTTVTSRSLCRPGIWLLACTALLSACVVVQPRQSDYWNTVLDEWKGRSAIDLWRSWGVPTKVVEAPNGNEMHLYVTEVRTQGAASGWRAGYKLAIPNTMWMQRSCESAFEIDADKTIIGWVWRGETCPHHPEDKHPAYWAQPVPIGF